MSTALSHISGVALALLPLGLVSSWLVSADNRLEEWKAAEKPSEEVAVAQAAEVGYCNARLKGVLRRVLTSCGLVGAEGGTSRGCQPLEARSIATMGGGDFNELFLPLSDRASIIQFDQKLSGFGSLRQGPPRKGLCGSWGCLLLFGGGSLLT